MLTLKGVITNVFTTDKRTTKAGESFGGDPKIQLLADVHLENGSTKKELIDLKVDSLAPFEKHMGKTIELPVGVFAPAKGNVVFFTKGQPTFS